MYKFSNDKKINRLLLIMALLLVVIMVTYLVVNSSKDKETLSYNNGFEEETLKTSQWNSEEDKSATFESQVGGAKEGAYCISIENEVKNDSRYQFSFKAVKGAHYKVSCWIKTESVGFEKLGATISLEGEYYTFFGDLRGDNDWTYVEGYIKAIGDQDVKIFLRLGGYSNENTGKVYFDDFTIEQIKTLPQEAGRFNTVTLGSSSFVREEYTVVMGYTVLAAIICFAFYVIYHILTVSGTMSLRKGEIILVTVLTLGFVLRLVAAPYARGFEGDVYLFKSWGDAMAKNGIWDFYEVTKIFKEGTTIVESSCDYPPFYMYVVGLVGKFMQWMNIGFDTYAFKLAIKMPPIIADVVSSFFIYKICGKIAEKENGKWMTKKWMIFFMALYLFNPMVLLDSVVWGQMDSFLAMFIILALYAVMSKKVTLSAILFGIAISIKPQGLFAGPVLLYYVLVEGGIFEKIKNFAKAAIGVVGTILVVSLPYILQYNIGFLKDSFLGTTDHFPFASVNGFNFFTLIGLNWEKDSLPGLFGWSHFTWGMVLLTTVVVLGLVFYWLLPKNYNAKAMLIGLFVTMGVFTFTVRMHERYLFPAIIMALIVAAHDNSRYMMYVYYLITATSFYNSIAVLGRYIGGPNIWFEDNPISLTYISLGNVIAFVAIAVYIVLLITKHKGAKFIEEGGTE